jgi:hypothetical protein
MQFYQQLPCAYSSQAYDHPTHVIILQSTSSSSSPDSGTLQFLNASTCIAICSKCGILLQTNELVKTQAYQQGNTKEALVQVFLRMDEILSQESVQGELQALAGPKNHADEEEE